MAKTLVERIWQRPTPAMAKNSNKVKAMKEREGEGGTRSAEASDQLCVCGAGATPRTRSGWMAYVTEQRQDFVGASEGLRGRKANGILRTEFPGTHPGRDAKLTIRKQSLKLTRP